MRSGGGVLLVAAAQLLVGLALLGVYEGFKSHYFRGVFARWGEEQKSWHASQPVTARSLNFQGPLDNLFYYTIANNVFALFGLAGVLSAQRELVTAFFGWNAVSIVLAFSVFIDTATDIGIRFAGEPAGLTGFEQAAAVLIFINFILSICASIFALRAVDELKLKQREEFTRLNVMSDTLAFDQ